MKEALIVAVEAISGAQTPIKQTQVLPTTVTNEILANHFEASVAKVADASLVPGYADTTHVAGAQPGAQQDLENLSYGSQNLMPGYADTSHVPGAQPGEFQHLMPGYADTSHVPGANDSIYEFQLHPVGDNQTPQRRLAEYLQDFSTRASNYAGDVNGATQSVSSDNVGSTAGVTNAVSEKSLSGHEALEMMKKTFEFAVEVELVSSVSNKSTKVVNDLMKGQ